LEQPEVVQNKSTWLLIGGKKAEGVTEVHKETCSHGYPVAHEGERILHIGTKRSVATADSRSTQRAPANAGKSKMEGENDAPAYERVCRLRYQMKGYPSDRTWMSTAPEVIMGLGPVALSTEHLENIPKDAFAKRDFRALLQAL